MSMDPMREPSSSPYNLYLAFLGLLPKIELNSNDDFHQR